VFRVIWSLVSVGWKFWVSKVEDGGDVEGRWSYYFTAYSDDKKIMFCTCTVDSFEFSDNVVMYDVYRLIERMSEHNNYYSYYFILSLFCFYKNSMDLNHKQSIIRYWYQQCTNLRMKKSEWLVTIDFTVHNIDASRIEHEINYFLLLFLITFYYYNTLSLYTRVELVNKNTLYLWFLLQLATSATSKPHVMLERSASQFWGVYMDCIKIKLQREL
jgi:hypothetical protein